MQILKRIFVRVGHGLWAQKVAVVVGVAVTAALFAYLEVYAPTQAGAGAESRSDCADTVMAALASNNTTGDQQQAYQCMDPTFQQQVSEQQFSNRLQASKAGRSITHVARVGSYQAPSGSEQLVYYAVDTGNQSVGFIIYMGENGKVLNIE